MALLYTTVSKNAFITAVNVVIVPFIGFFIYKRKLDKLGIISSFIALSGIGILSLQADFTVNFGDFLTFLCAIGFAFHIFFTGEFSEKYNEIKCDDCPATDICSSNGVIVDAIKKLVSDCIKYENELEEK